MKLTKTKLKQIIKEEIGNLSEGWQDPKVPNPVPLTPFTKEHAAELGHEPPEGGQPKDELQQAMDAGEEVVQAVIATLNLSLDEEGRVRDSIYNLFIKKAGLPLL
jgi:hypothetical protein